LIFFSNIYIEDKSVLDYNHLYRYLNLKDLIKRIRRMIRELLLHNPLIDYNEAIKIIKLDSPEQLRSFSHTTLKRYILNE
jgi:hypothetical protein